MPHLELELKLNAVSLANLVVLLGVLVSALGTWYSLTNRVDKGAESLDRLVIQLELERKERRKSVADIRSRQDNLLTLLRAAQDRTVDRLSNIEAQQAAQNAIISRIETQLQRVVGARP